MHIVDVFPDALKHLAALEASAGGPFARYRKVGYAVVGLLPEVNGFGKPDILMAKRMAGRQADGKTGGTP